MLAGSWPRQRRQGYALTDRHCATGPLSLAFLGLYSGRLRRRRGDEVRPGMAVSVCRRRFAEGSRTVKGRLRLRSGWMPYGFCLSLRTIIISVRTPRGSCLHDVYHLHSSAPHLVSISLRNILTPHLFQMLQADQIGIKHDGQKKTRLSTSNYVTYHSKSMKKYPSHL